MSNQKLDHSQDVFSVFQLPSCSENLFLRSYRQNTVLGTSCSFQIIIQNLHNFQFIQFCINLQAQKLAGDPALSAKTITKKS